jgi:hypothetical protein
MVLYLSDVDDTLIYSDDIVLMKDKNGDVVKELSTGDFALWQNNDGLIPDFSQFNDAKRIIALADAKPAPGLKLLFDHAKVNDDMVIGVLTARGQENVLYQSLRKLFMKYNIQAYFSREFTFALGSEEYNKTKRSLPEKKLEIIRSLINYGEFDKIIFVDDDIKNIEAVKSLKSDTVECILLGDHMNKLNVKENNILDYPDNHLLYSKRPKPSDYDIDRKLFGLENMTDKDIDIWRADQRVHNAQQTAIIDAAAMNETYDIYLGNHSKVIESLLKQGFSENKIVKFLSKK